MSFCSKLTKYFTAAKKINIEQMDDSIADSIHSYSDETVRKDLERLLEDHDDNSIPGNKFLDSFFFKYRLATKTKLNISFYEFLNSTFYREKPYVQKYLQNNKGTEILKLYKAFQLYFGTVNSFKPIIAKNLYYELRPTCILDFTAGWGGRCLGAMVIPSLKYIGIDTNIDLKTPYEDMLQHLDMHLPLEFAQFGLASQRSKIIFQDAATVDYSQLDYDMVFTSPPYYTLETYSNMPEYKSYEDWLIRFLQPVVTNSYKYMKCGFYCLNVPEKIYSDIETMIGSCITKIPLNLKRNLKNAQAEYNEHIYVWRKI